MVASRTCQSVQWPSPSLSQSTISTVAWPTVCAVERAVTCSGHGVTSQHDALDQDVAVQASDPQKLSLFAQWVLRTNSIHSSMENKPTVQHPCMLQTASVHFHSHQDSAMPTWLELVGSVRSVISVVLECDHSVSGSQWQSSHLGIHFQNINSLLSFNGFLFQSCYTEYSKCSSSVTAVTTPDLNICISVSGKWPTK